MIEHRLIERMVALMARELTRIRDNVAVDPEFAFVDPVFIDIAVDFLRTYADQCHHGKEEDILFAELEKKELSPEHRLVLDELLAEHVFGRQTIKKLVVAKENLLRGKKEAVTELLEHLGELVELYPRHIEKENRRFFIPVMDYFTPAEKEALLQRMYEFDREMIHNKYRHVVEQIETRKPCQI
jgi:hemerythrin-like domain-containing protein